MEVTLSDLTISIPYNHLLEDEMRMLEQLRNAQIHHSAYIGETFLNDRKRVIIYSYLISEMLTNQSFQNVAYVCIRRSQQQQLTKMFNCTLESFPSTNYPLESPIKAVNYHNQMKDESEKVLEIICWKDFIKQVVENKSEHRYFNMIIVEGNIIDDAMQQSLSADLSESVIRRAYKQLQKIQKYFRESHQQPYWNPQQAHKKLEKSFMIGKQIMQKKKTHHHYEELPSQSILINLCNIKYVIDYLQSKQLAIEKKKEIPTVKPSLEFINELSNKLLLPIKTFNNLGNILKAMAQSRSLSITHLLIVCQFFEKLVGYHDRFNKDYPGAFRVFTNPKSNQHFQFQIKLKCIDPKIIHNLLIKKSSSLLILQNFIPPKDFLRHLFTPPLPFLPLQANHSHHSIQSSHSKISIDKLVLHGPAESLLERSSLMALNVTSTPSEDDLSGKIKSEDVQNQGNIIRAYGVFLHDICQSTADGVVVYMPSSQHIIEFKKQWEKKERIYQQINNCKRIFQESEYEKENIQNLIKFRKCCDIGRGGVFILSCRGKMAQHEQFFDHYSRCIIFMGFPYNLAQNELKERSIYFKQISMDRIRLEDCLKHVTKCLSNCIRSVTEQKSILFVDTQFNDPAMKKWFPFLSKGNLSTLQGMELIRQFYRVSDKKALKKIVKDEEIKLGNNFKRQLQSSIHL